MNIRAASLPLFCLALAQASAALGCVPARNERSENIRGADCSVRHIYAGYGEEGLSAAEDIGEGFVEQIFSEGSACGWASSTIVVDCGSDRAAIFGSYDYSLGMMTPKQLQEWNSRPDRLLTDRVVDAAKAGRHMPVAEIVALAKASKLDNADRVAVSGRRVAISNSASTPKFAYDLGCGCRIFYPDSAGAKK